jgi:hypothetical protein
METERRGAGNWEAGGGGKEIGIPARSFGGTVWAWRRRHRPIKDLHKFDSAHESFVSFVCKYIETLRSGDPGPPNASSSRMRLEGFEGGAASDERPPQPWTTGGSPAGSCPTVARVRRPVNITL